MTITTDKYTLTQGVTWDIVYSCAVESVSGNASANATAQLLTNGGCPPANGCEPTTQQPDNADPDTVGPFYGAIASQSDRCFPNGEYGASASHKANADCDGGQAVHSLSVDQVTIIETCTPYTCYVGGSSGGTAQVTVNCVPAGQCGSFSSIVNVRPILMIDQDREFSIDPCPQSPTGGGSVMNPGLQGPDRGITSFVLVWGDASGELGRTVRQGYVERGEWSTNAYGNLFDDGGSGSYGPGVPQPVNCPPEMNACTPPAFDYSGELDIEIPLAVPANATWIEISASVNSAKGFSNDVNNDGVVDYWDRKAVGDLFGVALGDEAFDIAADLDGDLDIDSADGDILGALPCIADIDGNGLANVDDLDAYVAWFLGGNLNADLDGNGVLNVDDMDTYVAMFLTGC